MRKLKNEERKLRQEMSHLEYKIETGERKDCCSRLLRCVVTMLKPFRVTIGLVFLFTCFIMIVSLSFGNINRLIYSECGFKCGFQITDPKKAAQSGIIFSFIGLFDQIFVLFGHMFPLDLIVLNLMLVQFFLSTVYSITKQGIKVFFVSLYKIRKGSSYPQAIIMASLFLILIIFSFTFDLRILMPKYLTYGA